MITSIHAPPTGGEVIPYDLTPRNFWRGLFSFVEMCRFLVRYQPDLVISHNAKSSAVPLLAAFLMGIKSRIYFNHGVPFIAYRGVLRLFLRFLEYANCSLASAVITVSRDMKNILLRVKPQAQISIIANGSACGLDLNVYNASRYVDSLFRKKYQIAADDVVVVFVGRPEHRKGFDLVLWLWQKHFEDTRYKLVLCGSNQKDVRRILPNIPPNIICMGFVGNIAEILSNADCLILPSLHEGLSYAILEAMACECLVLANDIEGVRSLVRDGYNGYLVKDNSACQYAKIIRSLKSRSVEISQIRRHALETARDYSREYFLYNYLSFIERQF